MRYIGLVFLGLVFWAGQASAYMLSPDESLKVIIKGKTISEQYRRGNDEDVIRWSRVVYKNKLYICSDTLYKRTVAYLCYDDRL